MSPDCGRKREQERHTATGGACKNLTQKHPSSRPDQTSPREGAVARTTSTSRQMAMWCQVAARWPSANEGATVNLCSERVINLSEGREDQKEARTHGQGSDTSQFTGWSTYSSSLDPAAPPSSVWAAAASPGGSAITADVMRRHWVQAPPPPSAINVPACVRLISHM